MLQIKKEMVWHSLIAWIGFLSGYPKPTCGFRNFWFAQPLLTDFFFPPPTISRGRVGQVSKQSCCRNIQEWLKKVLKTYSEHSGDMIVINYNCWAILDHRYYGTRGMFLLFKGRSLQ